MGSDTGGALCQFLLDTDPSRIGRVVLTNCDAFDAFPPFPFSVMFFLLKGENRMRINLQPMRWRAFRHSPLGMGLLANTLDPAQTRAWIEPSLSDKAVRTDAVKFLRAAKRKDLLDVSTRLSRFAGPVTIVWGTADRVFTTTLGRRLQHAFGTAHFVEVPNARTLVSLDAPEQLADFYTDDPRRARSQEVAVGSDWRADDGAVPWRAAWLPSTGEFFVVPTGDKDEPDPGPVEVLGVLPDKYTLDVGLRGWWHQCGHVGSLGWLRITVAALAAPVR